MTNRYRYSIAFAVLFLLCLFPQRTFAADREVNLNKKATVTISEANAYGKSGNYTWLKYKASSDGYLKLKASTHQTAALEDSSRTTGYIALYDSTKTKLLSSKSIFYNTAYSGNNYWYVFYFGMQKGQTYYLRIKAENSVKFTRTFTKLSDKSGASRKTAKSLKRNKSRLGLMQAGATKADWYKITLTKKQKIHLYYNAKTSGSFRISLYRDNKMIGSRNIYYTSAVQKITVSQYLESSTKRTGLDKGTYYIKVEGANTLSSGYYKIKWN